MAVAIEMPKPGVTVEECLLVKWNRQEGDRVASGDIVAEIETDKATFEIAATADGVLLAQFFPEGELVPVYSNLCVIGEPGEDTERFRPKQAGAQSGTPAPQAGVAEVQDTAPAVAATPLALSTTASPRARRFADEHRISLAGLAGSGPGGRILESDVRDAWYSRESGPALAPAPAVPSAAPLPTPVAKSAGGVRDRIARRMRESLGTTAQYTLHTSADATSLLILRQKIKQKALAVDVNINELVMYCVVKALLQSLEVNAEYSSGELRRHEEVHLGFACDTPRGLLVPVIRDAQRLALTDFAAAAKKLTEQAVSGKISPDDLTGATFTVSNLGSLGVESFTPILNPPQVAILGVDAIQLRPVRRDGEVVFVDHIGLSLTLDHQVIDGAPGARFLQVLRASIENAAATTGWSE